MPDDREPYGRIVHELRVAHKAEQERRIPASWEDRDPRLRELDMRIGSAVAVQAVHDAKLENARRDAQLFALAAHLPVVLDALRIAEASGGYEYERKRYRASLEALGGSEGEGQP